MMKHKHRIVPGHMGGKYTPDNVVLLTVEEHAEAHKVLYQKYSNEYDRIAWLGLAKQIGTEQAYRLAHAENYKRLRGRKLSAETRLKLSQKVFERSQFQSNNMLGNQYRLGKKHSPETILKFRKPKSEEHKEKIRQSVINHYQKIGRI